MRTISNRLTARSIRRMIMTAAAGFCILGSAIAPTFAAPDISPAPLPPSIQPMPIPAPPNAHDGMPDLPLGPPARTPRPPTGAPKGDTAKPAPETKPEGPVQREADTPPDLNTLFDRLRSAKSEEKAGAVNLMIEAEMLQSGSDTIDLLMYRALSAVQNQDMPLAMDLLDTVIALKPDYAEGWNKRATLYFMKRDYGKAISDVEMVLRLQPRHYAALIGLAQMLAELGDTKHALEALKRVLAIYPLNSAVTKQIDELQSTLSGRNL